jgi:hypothetical protein
MMRRRKIGKRALDWLERNLKGYEVTLTRIIPRDIEHENDAVGEEIFYLLYVREELEKDFQQYGWDDELSHIWQRLHELDQILIAQRDTIVDAYHPDYYRSQRERLKMPPEYWWWYLDDLEAAELPEWVMAESTRN